MWRNYSNFNQQFDSIDREVCMSRPTESIFKFSLADQLTSKYIPSKKDPIGLEFSSSSSSSSSKNQTCLHYTQDPTPSRTRFLRHCFRYSQIGRRCTPRASGLSRYSFELKLWRLLNFASSLESLIEIKKNGVSSMSSDPTPSRTGALRNRFLLPT
jgi:hypothetical protein